MGLDLVPLGKAKPGFEAEWVAALEAVYDGSEESEAQRDRRLSVSVEPGETVAAPRVGIDDSANAWILKRAKDAGRPETDEEIIKKHHGYHALELLQGDCDGIPRYTNAGLYDGIDPTSFRGSFLEGCTSYLDEETIARAWTACMRPEEAVRYGETLLARATNPPASPPPPEKKGLFSRLLGGERRRDQVDPAEQVNILAAAGRWYVFWGGRGHPVAAWF